MIPQNYRSWNTVESMETFEPLRGGALGGLGLVAR